MTNTGGKDQQDEFGRFKGRLKSLFGTSIYQSWFDDLELVDASNGKLVLQTPSPIKRDFIGQRYTAAIKQCWAAVNGPVAKIVIRSTPGLRSKMSAHAAKVDRLEIEDPQNEDGRKRPARLFEFTTPIDERNTFKAYAIDETNQMAFAAARQIFIEGAPRELVYFHGPSGVGKTHILQAIGNEFAHPSNGSEQIGKQVYLTYSNIKNAWVRGVWTNSVDALHRDFRSNALVMIDDIHLLAGTTRSQEETLNVIDALLASGKQVVVAGELPPTKLAEHGVNRRLADRLAGGLSVAINPGSSALRLEVLKKRLKIGSHKCLVAGEALDYVVRNFANSMRETIGALNQLLLLFRDHEGEVSLDDAQIALRERLRDGRKVVTLDEALDAVSDVFGVARSELEGTARPQRIARARHAFNLFGRDVLHESYPRLGAKLGRDHTTAMSSKRRADALIERDKAFQKAYRAVCERLGG